MVTTTWQVPIDRMVAELLEAGWVKKRTTLWKAPWGDLYRGPAHAWKIMCYVDNKS